MRKPSAGLVLLVTLAAPGGALATPLTFSFTGVAGSGSSMNLGSGSINVSGAAFTAAGVTINDVDVFGGGTAGDRIGAFAATVTYNFGGLGSFTTNDGGDFYIQFCGTLATISCVLLANVSGVQGFRMNFTPSVAGSPDFGIPIGTKSASDFAFVNRTQTNSSGHSLTIGGTGASLSSATATAVPEPGTLLLLGAGLACLGAVRRRRK